jgi:hypothetical protein
MRLFGVDNQRASEHDDEVVVLDQQFAKYVREITEPRNGDQTLHT